MTPKTPYLTVDGIIEYQDNKEKGIILIERKNPPHGWAFPGGFVDYGESVEDALIREMKEETNLDVSIVKLLGVYSDPNRDKRMHAASVVYVVKGEGKLKAKDDAKNAILVPLNKVKSYNLVFDHKKILKDYIKNKKYANKK